MLCVFSLLLAILWCSKDPVHSILEVSIRWICRLLWDRPQDIKKNLHFLWQLSTVARSCFIRWWCYTCGGRGESSTPKQCKAIWVLAKSTEMNKNLYLIKYSDWNSGWSCFFRLTNGCVWAEGGRKHPCQAGCYGSVTGAVSGYGISRWSPFSLHVLAKSSKTRRSLVH